jgi:hypothetical protein
LNGKQPLLVYAEINILDEYINTIKGNTGACRVGGNIKVKLPVL